MEDRIKSREELLTELSDYRRRLMSCQSQCCRLARDLSLCESRERRRLAEYLHDRLGQSLYFAEMKVRDLWEENVGSPGAELLENIWKLLQSAGDELRALLKELYPQTLMLIGLAPAVTAMAEEFERQHHIEIECEIKGEWPFMPEDLGHLIYRTTRELVVNALKHAGSKKIWIGLERMEDRIEVCVRDEGVGFDSARVFEQGGISSHFGLISIVERLGPLGGRLDIESQPGKGARITVVMPLPEDGNGKEKD